MLFSDARPGAGTYGTNVETYRVVMKVRAISYLAATAALLGNPLFACDDPVDYLITRAEVENALQGEWTVLADGHTSRFAIDFGPRSSASRA